MHIMLLLRLCPSICVAGGVIIHITCIIIVVYISISETHSPHCQTVIACIQDNITYIC